MTEGSVKPARPCHGSQASIRDQARERRDKGRRDGHRGGRSPLSPGVHHPRPTSLIDLVAKRRVTGSGGGKDGMTNAAAEPGYCIVLVAAGTTATRGKVKVNTESIVCGGESMAITMAMTMAMTLTPTLDCEG